MASPLEGVRVLDLCPNAPGWYASALLGDFGADVIQVQDPRPPAERGSGDAGSIYAQLAGINFHAACAVNRNKRGIAINDELLRALGYDEATIAALLAGGAVV